MTRHVRYGVVACVLGGLSWSSTGAIAQGPSASPVPVVVELFTSEGCSSCPPADRLLMDLLSQQPVPGAVVIGLSEHVDYWNQLGWTDPFSSAAFSHRQSEYASSLGGDDVYTPQMVVDGMEPFVGSDRAAALDAIGRAAAKPKVAVKLRWAAASALDVSLDRSPVTAGATLMLAVVEDGLESAVARGENQGRHLSHAAVARRLVTLGKADGSGAAHFTPAVPLDPSWKRAAVHIVVFAQQRGRAGIVAAGSVGPS